MEKEMIKKVASNYSHAKLPAAVVFLGLLVQSHILRTNPTDPVVEISTGALKGKFSHSRNGRPFTEFLGIPYAKPPLGDKRFEAPELPDRWEGIRSAQSLGGECFAAELLTTGRIVGQEDCLYLNVHRPGKFNVTHTGPDRLLPVIVYIHGGGFFMGSSNLYPASYFMDQDVILVTMNYRLAAFGFLSTGDGIVPGNMGLKDQVMALKWVQQNIIHFGGNPKQVTIAGESAGGISVHMHMLSPMSKGLFHRAISISGTAANSDWALHRNNSETAFDLGRRVGCPLTNDTGELIQCLRKVPGHQIMTAYFVNKNPLADIKYMMLPAIESTKDSQTFLPDDPMTLMEQGKFSNVPYMQGIMEYEGLVYVLRMLQNHVNPFQLRDRKFRNENLGKLLYYKEGTDELWDKIYGFYFNPSRPSKFKSNSKEKFMESLATLFTDRFFSTGLHSAAKWQSQQSPVYLFQMTYTPKFNVFYVLQGANPSSWIPFEVQMGWHLTTQFLLGLFGWDDTIYGVSHGDDVPLAFRASIATDITRFSRDYTFSQDFVKLLVDFGTNPDHVQFRGVDLPQVKPGDTVESLPFIKLDTMPAIITGPYSERMHFFQTIPLK